MVALQAFGRYYLKVEGFQAPVLPKFLPVVLASDDTPVLFFKLDHRYLPALRFHVLSF